MNLFSILLIALTAASVAALLMYLAMHGKVSRLQARLQAESEAHRRIEDEIRKAGETSLDEVRKTHADTLQRQMDAVRAGMKAETEQVLKAREEELSRQARETFSSLAGGLEKDLKDMKDAFESNKKTQNDTSSSLKESFANAVRSLEEHTRSIGDKADNLADALRGQNKMQGCWGETILQTLLDNEGFTEGVNYDREETLRDASGNVLINEDSGARMRPDYIIHFPDNNDVVIDSKVSLVAFSDYLQAGTEEGRQEASRRNLASVKEQVRLLSRKNYASYLQEGHRMLDYAIMFVPNYSALQLAYQEEPSVWRDAFNANVLVTSEETLMPFLRMITIAWRNSDQVRNQKEIIEAAGRMLDRVHDLAAAHAEMGRKLDDARKAYERCSSKLSDSGQSIVKAAHDVVRLGVPENPKKKLPFTEN